MDVVCRVFLGWVGGGVRGEGERRRRGEEEKGREGVGKPFGILIKMHINGQALLKKDPQVPALAIISFELIGICS